VDQLPTPTPLITKAQLKAWLQVSDMWVRDRLAEPEFVRRCVIDLAPEGSSKRTLRFHVASVAAYLGIPAEAGAGAQFAAAA
jgi:hypothetical protein